MAQGISTESWLQELERVSARNDGGSTVAELSARLGIGIQTVRGRIKRAMALGWVRVGRRMSTTIDGKPHPSPVYTIEAPAKKK